MCASVCDDVFAISTACLYGFLLTFVTDALWDRDKVSAGKHFILHLCAFVMFYFDLFELTFWFYIYYTDE